MEVCFSGSELVKKKVCWLRKNAGLACVLVGKASFRKECWLGNCVCPRAELNDEMGRFSEDPGTWRSVNVTVRQRPS